MTEPRRIVFGLLVFAAAAVVAAPGEQLSFLQRSDAFSRQQQTRRRELRLSMKEAYRRYPTPELQLVRPVRVLPGRVAEVKVKGHIPRGAFVAFSCDDLEVLSLRPRPSGVAARVRVPKFFQQAACQLHVKSPVSGAFASVPALEVPLNYVWRLNLSDGTRVDVATRPREEGVSAVSTWRRRGATIAERRIGLALPTPQAGEVRAKVERTAEDERASAERWRADPASRRRDQLFTELASLRRGLHRCGADADCARRSEQQMTTLFTDGLAEVEQREKEIFHPHPVACDELVLTVHEDGRVTGRAFGCAGGGTAQVRGEITARER